MMPRKKGRRTHRGRKGGALWPWKGKSTLSFPSFGLGTGPISAKNGIRTNPEPEKSTRSKWSISPQQSWLFRKGKKPQSEVETAVIGHLHKSRDKDAIFSPQESVHTLADQVAEIPTEEMNEKAEKIADASSDASSRFWMDDVPKHNVSHNISHGQHHTRKYHPNLHHTLKNKVEHFDDFFERANSRKQLAELMKKIPQNKKDSSSNDFNEESSSTERKREAEAKNAVRRAEEAHKHVIAEEARERAAEAEAEVARQRAAEAEEAHKQAIAEEARQRAAEAEAEEAHKQAIAEEALQRALAEEARRAPAGSYVRLVEDIAHGRHVKQTPVNPKKIGIIEKRKNREAKLTEHNRMLAARQRNGGRKTRKLRRRKH